MTMLQRHEKTRKRKARYDYTALIEAGRSICPQRHRFLRPDPRRVFASPANTDQLRPLSDACEVQVIFSGSISTSFAPLSPSLQSLYL